MTDEFPTTKIPPYKCPKGILISASSHLVDRFVPDCEVITLPPKTVRGGSLKIKLKESISHSDHLRTIQRAAMFGKKAHELDGVLIDFRTHHPQNWAHFLNDHLPLLYKLIEESGLKKETLRVLLPKKTPRYIVEAAKLFSINTIQTDTPVKGSVLAFSLQPWTSNRPVRHLWARSREVDDILLTHGVFDASSYSLPRKLFISRRATRNLENETEIAELLSKRGYHKIYAEDFSASDQFKIFQHAEEIVSIHGAAIAPLLYRRPESLLSRLVELFPCGHMTDNFRVMCHQVGCRWIGVRGRIKPEHIAGAYDLDKPFLEYSLQSFSVDPKSLEIALDMK
ncbi:glycosyltransferase family 61 protein [Lutimaribacter saemankumensis]|uniref:Glycosyltransferase 61 catalytic domain-containing protein n=1 Tax=Lutimaribacter saemankumensis TaxID=490829 RepID=A0A1G8M0R8_9RHOB|nr:glycosyltransferase 61 family protein [Lutimaribacter saemankumensis]SDI61554.1 Protein of unknown function [Lutimaribacter saemankumensis]